MIDYLNQTISLSSLLWLFMIVFMLHDLEEIIMLDPWMKKNRSFALKKIPSGMRGKAARILDIKSYQFAVAVLLEFIVFIPVTFIAVERGQYFMFLAFNSVLLLHVFMHVGQSIILRRYTIGVVSAVVLVLPYTVYLFYRLTSEGIVTWGQILWSALAGLVLIPMVWIGHELGKRLLP